MTTANVSFVCRQEETVAECNFPSPLPGKEQAFIASSASYREIKVYEYAKGRQFYSI